MIITLTVTLSFPNIFTYIQQYEKQALKNVYLLTAMQSIKNDSLDSLKGMQQFRQIRDNNMRSHSGFKGWLYELGDQQWVVDNDDNVDNDSSIDRRTLKRTKQQNMLLLRTVTNPENFSDFPISIVSFQKEREKLKFAADPYNGAPSPNIPLTTNKMSFYSYQKDSCLGFAMFRLEKPKDECSAPPSAKKSKNSDSTNRKENTPRKQQDTSTNQQNPKPTATSETSKHKKAKDICYRCNSRNVSVAYCAGCGISACFHQKSDLDDKGLRIVDFPEGKGEKERHVPDILFQKKGKETTHYYLNSCFHVLHIEGFNAYKKSVAEDFTKNKGQA